MKLSERHIIALLVVFDAYFDEMDEFIGTNVAEFETALFRLIAPAYQNQKQFIESEFNTIFDILDFAEVYNLKFELAKYYKEEFEFKYKQFKLYCERHKFRMSD